MRRRGEAGASARRRWFGSIALALLLCSLLRVASATSSLSFEGGGYVIDLEIGDDAMPVVAAVHFHAPGDARGVVLTHDSWRVLAFDPRRQRLLLQHDDASVVPAFSLSVQRDDAVLVIEGRRVHASFDWSS